MTVTHQDNDKIVFGIDYDDSRIWLKVERSDFGYKVQIYGYNFESSYNITRQDARHLMEFLRKISLPDNIQP